MRSLAEFFAAIEGGREREREKKAEIDYRGDCYEHEGGFTAGVFAFSPRSEVRGMVFGWQGCVLLDYRKLKS